MNENRDQSLEYKHYATYVFMRNSRGIIRIDNYNHKTGQLEISIVFGEPDQEEAQKLLFQTINSGEILTKKKEFQKKKNDFKYEDYNFLNN